MSKITNDQLKPVWYGMLYRCSLSIWQQWASRVNLE